MREVVIASAVRTPIGRYQGSLSSVPAVELGQIVITEVLKRARVRPERVDEVIMGNVLQAGLGQNPAGRAAQGAGINQYVPSLTVSKVCGAGMKSVIMAAQTIKAGDADIVVAGGMENMSRAAALLPSAGEGAGKPGKIIDAMVRRGVWCSVDESCGEAMPEEVGERFGISREEQDAFAARSHQKAEAAILSGRFKEEIVPVRVKPEQGGAILVDTDENPIKNATQAKLAQLEPALGKGGTVTRGNSSAIADGAAALLLMSAEKAFKIGLRPLARIITYDYHWCEPELMGFGPIYAVRSTLHRARDREIKQIDLVELNETYAAQSIVSLRELNLNAEIVNVNGGAIALGHPLGSSGARILTTLLYEMQRRDARVGLAAGMGIACLVERQWYF